MTKDDVLPPKLRGNSSHEDNSSEPFWNTTKMEVPAIVGTLSTCGVTIGIISIVFNITFILALSQIHEKDKPYYRLTKCLSICDLLGSVSFILIINFPQGIIGFITQNNFRFLQALPYIFRSIPWMFFTGYLLTLTCLSINQYIAICKPWRYNQLVTRRTVTWSVVGVWIVSSLQVCIISIMRGTGTVRTFIYSYGTMRPLLAWICSCSCMQSIHLFTYIVVMYLHDFGYLSTV